MKKFTLLSNDKDLNFKINQAWDLSFPKTVIKNAYCHKYFIDLIETRKRHTGDNWAKNVFSLELYKRNNKIVYEIEDIKLHLKGAGKKIKVISIEVIVNEDTNKAKIEINAQQELSFSENLKQELQKFGMVRFIADDFGSKIEIEDLQNDNLIMVTFQGDKLKIIATYKFDYDSEFDSTDAEKLLKNKYSFAIFKDNLVIDKVLNNSNEIVTEIKNNIYQKF